ncbi:hypothetical protein TrispH2_005089, partial [Trichoplax sp. H2]
IMYSKFIDHQSYPYDTYIARSEVIYCSRISENRKVLQLPVDTLSVCCRMSTMDKVDDPVSMILRAKD